MTAEASSSKIGIAVPAYQAAQWIGNVVERAIAQQSELGEEQPTLVIDDGSQDSTSEVAREAGAEVIRHPQNRGKGAALRTAFEAMLDSGCEAVITLDADGQHLPEEIPKLLAAYRETQADLVLGTRSHLFDGMTSVRRWSNRLSSLAISFAAGESLIDVQTGFRLYSRRLILGVPFHGCRFDAESAIVVRAARRGFRVISVPVELGFPDGRATSHYRPLVDSLRIARAVTRARFDRSRINNPRLERAQ